MNVIIILSLIFGHKLLMQLISICAYTHTYKHCKTICNNTFCINKTIVRFIGADLIYDLQVHNICVMHIRFIHLSCVFPFHLLL